MENRSCLAEEGFKMHTFGRIGHSPIAEVNGEVFTSRGGSTGCVMIMEPLSPIFNYFEYLILNKGMESSVGIGIGELGYPLHRMPGWNRNGIGYHGDDGKLYHENGGGRGFGPTCTEGDRMGCGVDFSKDVSDSYYEVFFTKNGEPVGEPVRMKRPVYGLYPIVGLHSRGEQVRYLGHWHKQRQGLQEPMELDYSPSNMWMRANGIQFLEDGRTLEYCGHGGDAQDPTLAQAKFPLSKVNHYFELVILSSGKVGAIAIGLGKSSYPLHTHPGWSSGAVGYHADDGRLFVEREMGVEFGPPCSEGDRMGCGILFDAMEDKKGEEVEGSVEKDGGAEGVNGEWMGEDDYMNDDDDISMLEDDFMDSDDDEEFGRRLLDREVRNRVLRPRVFNMALGRHHHFEDNEILLRQKRAMAIYELGGGARRGGRGGHRFPKIIPRRLPSRDSLTMDNSTSKCMVFFTKNGEIVGKTKVSMPKGGLYPLVGMLSRGEKVQVDLQPLSG